MSKKKTKKKYYHSSKTLFKPGDHLVPNRSNWQPNFNASCSTVIYLTEAPEPHYTVADRANEEGWYVYEVMPTGKVWLGTCWDEWCTTKPCIVQKRIGNARGISKAGRANKKESEENNEKWWRERLEEAKNALKSQEARDKWDQDWRITPEETIKDMQAKIQYKNSKTSKAMYLRTPPCTIINYNAGFIRD